MSETVKSIVEIFEKWQYEDEKFSQGNNAAGTRARKALQDLTKMAKSRRSEISLEKTTRKQEKIKS